MNRHMVENVKGHAQLYHRGATCHRSVCDVRIEFTV